MTTEEKLELNLPSLCVGALSVRCPRHHWKVQNRGRHTIAVENSCHHYCEIMFNWRPPDSTKDWPRTVGDIGRLEMDRILSQADPGAVGSRSFRDILANLCSSGRWNVL
jgi:hypothetical protein